MSNNTSGRVKTSSSSENDVEKVLQNIFNEQPFPSSIEHEDGDRAYRTRFIANTDYDGTLAKEQPKSTTALGLTIEITDVRARAKLKVDNEQLLANERAAIEASQLKSRFLANMSHEIRTPIAGVVGMNNLLFESGLDEDQKQLSQGIQQSSAFLLALVNDILDFSKIEAGHMDIEKVEFQPSAIMDGIFRLMSFQAQRKQLPLIYHNNLPEDISVIGDPQRLQQVLMNLLGNSIKFTSSGEITLTMKLALSKRDSQCFERDLGATAGSTKHSNSAATPTAQKVVTLEYVVKDTGCGIEEETMAKLFKPFSQADTSTARRHGGTGLGLTISRQLVELMGGTIELASIPNVGSTATVRIPYHRPSQAQAVKEVILDSQAIEPNGSNLTLELVTLGGSLASPIESVETRIPAFVDTLKSSVSTTARSSIRVLVVEDNLVNQRIAVTLVRKLGFAVSAVNNGEEALDYLASRADSVNPRPNMILMDCMMPIMDGYEASRNIRRDTDRFPPELRRIPIIAVTASAIKGERERCESAGMDDYLSKPIVKAELERVLVRWTTQGKSQHGRP